MVNGASRQTSSYTKIDHFLLKKNKIFISDNFLLVENKEKAEIYYINPMIYFLYPFYEYIIRILVLRNYW